MQDGFERFKFPHKVLYLPPYHPEYNAIELAWARVKHFIGRHLNYNLENILNVSLPDALRAVTPEISKKIIGHVIEQWKTDIEDKIDPMDITAKIQENLYCGH